MTFNNIVVLATLCLLVKMNLVISKYHNFKTLEYPYGIILDPEQRLKLDWNPDYRTSNVYFRITGSDVTPKTWFGVGFSDYGETTKADFVVFWTSPSGVHHFQDAYTDNEGILHVDPVQNYRLQKARSGGQVTILQFSRQFDTCDEDDYEFDRGTTHIVYFIAPDQPQSIDHVNITALKTGLQRVQLLKPHFVDPPLPADSWKMEVTNPAILVPSEETTYWWYIAKLPALRKKHHIVKYEGVIQQGHEGLVHHMEVFHCEVDKNEIIRDYNGPGEAEGKPPELEACRKVIGAWAMGAKPLSMPAEAGIPIGGEQFSRYVLLEVHYNNPGKVPSQIDSSGIRFYVTSQLRPFDAGVMELGLEYSNKMAIPPGQISFPLTGFCIQQCTDIGIPEGGIYVYASQLHTHLTGRKVYTKHVRGGVELPELNRDNHYSPHFQEIRPLSSPVHVLPGDELLTTCEYGTSEKSNATIGGFSISDEMCVNYVHYYPLVNLEVCKSSIDTDALQKFFAFMKRWDNDSTSPEKGDRANYNSIRWTKLTSLLLNTLYMTSPISMQCNQSDGSRFPGDWEGIHPTRTYTPLQPEVRECP